MKAVVFDAFGGLDVLRVAELPDPEPGPGEVLLDVTASALNHLDVDVREGVSRFRSRSRISSGSSPSAGSRRSARASRAMEVGDRVAAYLIATCGDCVYCRTGRESLCTSPASFISMGAQGAYADKLTCRASTLIRVPDEVSDVEAAAALIAFGTAWHMLVTRAKVCAGEKVLDHLGRERHRLGRSPGRQASAART